MDDVRKLVKVKPLQWEPVGAEFWARDSYGDNYEVAMNEAGNWSVNHSRLFASNLDFASPDDAKAAAQADHEARILAALTPASDGRAEGLREAAAWHEAAAIARDHGFTNAQWRAGGENVRGALFHLFMARAAELEKADE